MKQRHNRSYQLVRSNAFLLNSTHTETIPSPEELLEEFPLLEEEAQYIQSSRQEIRDILHKRDSRHLMIVGPCSIHDVTSATLFAKKLKALAQSLSDTFLLVMRVYFEKPRTLLGWKGILRDPDLDNSYDTNKGLRLTRQLLLELAELQVPVATEFLDPASAFYFSDLISWGCIGARTAASQTHRQLASGLPLPVAFKNSTDGNIDIAINGVVSASIPHSFIGMNEKGKAQLIHTQGNPDGHIVLRGSDTATNYDPESITYATEQLQQRSLTPRLLIDCSHGNSRRTYQWQTQVFESAIQQIQQDNRNIAGMLLESHLEAGNQILSENPTQLNPSVSITDSCLDWFSTEKLLRWGYAQLQESPTKLFATDLK